MTDSPLRALPESIRRRRAELGWTQLDLARRLGVHQSQVARWETGRREPSAAQLVRLMDLLTLGRSDIT